MLILDIAQMTEVNSEKTKLNSNLKIFFQQKPQKENSYLKRTFNSSKGVYLSSIKNNSFSTKSTETDNITTINLDDFSIIEELGHGAFGTVYKAFNDKWDYLALKIISFPKNIQNDYIQNLKQQVYCEKFLLEQVNLLKNRHFIKFYSIFKDNSDSNEEKLIFAMENGAGNMNDILYYRKSYSQKEIIYIIHYISEALTLCELNCIANRDIKPDNFIIIKDEIGEFYYKIADFGIGCQLSTDQKTLPISECPGYTELYAAPELMNLKGTEVYNPFKADVFSLGVTILKMMGIPSNQIKLLKNNFLKSFIDENTIKGYEKLLGIVKKMMSKNPEERPSFNEISKMFRIMPKMKPYEKEYFKKLEEKIDNLSNEQKAIKCEKMFHLYNKINDLEKSKYFAQLCLNISYRLRAGFNNYSSAEWNFIMGCLYQEEEDYDSAIKFYKKAYEILYDVDESFSFLTADIFNNISIIYREQGKYDIAFKLFTKSLRIRKYFFGKNDLDYGDSLNNLASIYQLFNLKKALKLYEQAYLISINGRGYFHNCSLILMNNIAETHRKLGNLEEAIKLNKKCLRLKESTLSEVDISIAITLNNLSLAYYSAKKYEKSIKNQEKSIEIKKKILSEEHFSLGNSYNNLGIIYEKLKNDEKALWNFQQAFRIRKLHFGKKHELVQECSNNILRIMEKSEIIKKYFKKKEN